MSPRDELFAAAREQFAGTRAGPFFDMASRALLYTGGRAALDKHLDDMANGTIDKAGLFSAVEECREQFAALICSHPDEVAFTRNVTDGIAAFGAALDWKPGDTVVVCEELEHPANIYPWYGLARKHGLVVKNVRQKRGVVPLEDILHAIDERCRVVAISAVSFAPGFLFPVPQLGAECRRRGVHLVVDTAQSIGVVETDVEKWGCDALAASTQKGLMSLYGLGFLYVRRSVAETLNPAYLSRFGVEQEGHEASLGNPISGPLAAGARRFDVGNYNYPAIVTVTAALKLILDLTPKAVEQHTFGLACEFAERMLALGLPVFGGRPGSQSTHIVTIGSEMGFDHDSAADLSMKALYEHLVAEGVRLSIRRDLLRFSFGLYNNRDDIARVERLIREWMRGRNAAQNSLEVTA
ncbi:aminotransferase class V-fold PLP-dependent enzyme [Methylobacterium sp. J-070]|uniref:aminotransferase class V-fold PLP-dependent enzyme n=1 Tax=Methylobacterium sp. J-070 TaxID=2836650 RepID=UPI001FB96E07|nr:aminotransferase class V-fold PLP-dependent enzyme [Methylobacterium sp. J-070]MCJ2052509.1 aminotransferase class V-fold PLP-dependent enzyme [Methylobacterium sp. J-070]